MERASNQCRKCGWTWTSHADTKGRPGICPHCHCATWDYHPNGATAHNSENCKTCIKAREKIAPLWYPSTAGRVPRRRNSAQVELP